MKIINLIIHALVLVCAFACHPSQRIARIIKKHPELKTTTLKDTTITIAPINDSLLVRKDTSTTEIDSVLDAHKIEDKKTREDIEKVVLHKKVIKDTTIVTSGNVKVSLSDTGNGIKVKIEKPKQEVKVKQEVQNINVKKSISVGGVILALSILLLIVGMIFKIIKG